MVHMRERKIKKKGKDDVTTMRAHAHELINWTTWIQYYNVIYLISKFSLNPMITRVVIVKLIKKTILDLNELIANK